MSKKLQPLILATFPSIEFRLSMGKVVKIKVALIRPWLWHTYRNLMVVPYEAREQKTPANYFLKLLSIGFLLSMGKVVIIKVVLIRPWLRHTYQNVMVVPDEAREPKTLTSYFCHFSLN